MIATKRSTRQSATCKCCGRDLTDPISVRLGIGPVCRISAKEKEYQEKTGNLFSNEAEFIYREHIQYGGKIVVEIIDRLAPKSVTNDIENVLKKICDSEERPDFFQDKKVMYRDSFGVYDGIRVSGTYPHFSVTFYSLNETSQYQALGKIFAHK